MADPAAPTPHDQPGHPIWGGYLEADRPTHLSAVPQTSPPASSPASSPASPSPSASSSSPASRRPPRRRPRPPSWNGDLDSYDLADPNYNPDGWYTATRGADKLARTLQVRVPEYCAEAIDQLVARRCFPAVRTPQDFIRSSVVHELHRRIGEVRDPEFTVAPSAHTDLAEINALRAENDAMKAFVVNCRDELAEVDGSPTRTRRVLELVWAAMDSGIYDGAHFRQLEDLTRKYWGDRGLGHQPRTVGGSLSDGSVGG